MSRRSTSSPESFRDFCREILKEEALLRQGGGKAGLVRQRSNSRTFLANHPHEEHADERETDYLAACSFFSRARNRASRSSLKMVLNSMFLLSHSFFVVTESVIAPL